MKIPSLEDLQELIEVRDQTTLSLYMPTFRKSVETRQNPIRFKNLMTQAEERLLSRGMAERQVKEFLEPLREMQDRHDFWQNQGHGLAAFRSENDLLLFQLPIKPKEEVFVGDRFHLKPLLRSVTGQDRFYVLALSQNQARMMLCSNQSERELEIEGMPESMAEALRHTEARRQLQLHTGSREPGGSRSAIFHGHGVPKDDDKVRILEYFRIIDKSLRPILNDQDAPLVLAGVEFLFPLYKEATSYSNVLAGVKGNPEGLSAEELRKKAWEIVKPQINADRRALEGRFVELSGTDRASDDPRQVIPAARQGRVESLFVPVDVYLWGKLHEDGRLETHAERQPESQDLLDLTAIETLTHRGKVFAVPAQKLPGKGPLAAIFRY